MDANDFITPASHLGPTASALLVIGVGVAVLGGLVVWLAVGWLRARRSPVARWHLGLLVAAVVALAASHATVLADFDRLALVGKPLAVAVGPDAVNVGKRMVYNRRGGGLTETLCTVTVAEPRALSAEIGCRVAAAIHEGTVHEVTLLVAGDVAEAGTRPTVSARTTTAWAIAVGIFVGLMIRLNRARKPDRAG